MAYQITYQYPRKVFHSIDPETGEVIYKTQPAEKFFVVRDASLESASATARTEAVNGEITIEHIPDPETLPTQEEDTAAMLVDHELRLTLLELGLTE